MKSVHEPDCTTPQPPSATPRSTSTYARLNIWTLRATGQCITGALCPEPSGLGGFKVEESSVNGTGISFSAEYYVVFDQALEIDSLSPDVVEVRDAGPDNLLNTADDVVVEPVATLTSGSTKSRLTVFLSPTGDLVGGRHYRVTILPGCMRVRSQLDFPIGLDGEFSGSFPSGDGQQGGAFSEEFVGIARHVFARNTGAMSGLAVHPITGDLYGAGLAGAFGPIHNGVDISSELRPLVPEIITDGDSSFLYGAVVTADGATLIITRRGSRSLQRIPLRGGATTIETVEGLLGEFRHLRIVPEEFGGGTLSAGQIMFASGPAHISILDLNADPASTLPFARIGRAGADVKPFHFNADGTLTVISTSQTQVGPLTMIENVSSSGLFIPLTEASIGGNAGSFRAGNVMVGFDTGGLHQVWIGRLEDGRVASFSQLFPGAAEDLVLSLDRTQAFVAVPQSNVILEYFGFPVD